MIIIEPCAGLGNRLLGLGTAYSISRMLGRELLVVWKREAGCNIAAERLFDLPVRVEEISENGWKKEPLAQMRGAKVQKKYRGMASRFLSCDDVEQIRRDEGYDGILSAIEKEKIIYIKAFGPLCMPEPDVFAFLKPAANIEAKGSALFSQLDGTAVGVHIRRTDHAEAIAHSPLSLFEERMRDEMRQDENVLFFVATDDANVKKEMRTALPDARIIFSETSVLDRNAPEGIEDALVEMLALSKCRKILGSYNSTFGQLAAYLGRTPIEIVAT